MRISASPRFLPLIAILVILALAFVAACGGGGGSSPSNTPGSSDHPDPEAALNAMIAAFNQQDVQTFYNGLSADRRATTTLADLQGALEAARVIAGVVPKLEINDITAKRVNGDSAEIDTTLNVVISGQKLPVTDTAQMKWEDGSWRLADHFIDQALAVLALGGGRRSSRAPTATP